MNLIPGCKAFAQEAKASVVRIMYILFVLFVSLATRLKVELHKKYY